MKSIVTGLLVSSAMATAQERGSQPPDLNRQFQVAVAEYNAGKLPDSASHLEALLPYGENTFEIHELLGLVYAGESKYTKAVEQLETAVHLKPASAAARTNLAASLVHAGKPGLAEKQFQVALQLEPASYDANHNLGEYYIQSQKIAEAVPLLQKAQEIQPSYNNGYDLALAYFLNGSLSQAAQLIQTLEQTRNTGELHDLLAQIDEKRGDFVAAVNEYEVAAHLDPTEGNLFDWGSELLLHRTLEPAIEVFKQAVQRYPNSPRLQIGLGMALYSRGNYDDAVKALIAAADLDPSDPRVYPFLSQAYDRSPGQMDEVIQRFHRFSEIRRNDGLATYYYAMSLWRGKQAAAQAVNLEQVERLLQKSIALDPNLSQAYVQLGNLYADRQDYAKSIADYERALKLDPNLPDAHYRLSQDYRHTGQKDHAQQEMAIYQKLRAAQLAATDRENTAVQQFVYSAQGNPSGRQPNKE